MDAIRAADLRPSRGPRTETRSRTGHGLQTVPRRSLAGAMAGRIADNSYRRFRRAILRATANLTCGYSWRSFSPSRVGLRPRLSPPYAVGVRRLGPAPRHSRRIRLVYRGGDRFLLVVYRPACSSCRRRALLRPAIPSPYANGVSLVCEARTTSAPSRSSMGSRITTTTGRIAIFPSANGDGHSLVVSFRHDRFRRAVRGAGPIAGGRSARVVTQDRLEKAIASWLAAACLGLFFLLALHIVDARYGGLTTLLLAVGSGLCSTVGQALWQHGGVIFWMLLALLIEFRTWRRPTGGSACFKAWPWP